MNSFSLRLLSAVVAILVIIGFYFWIGIQAFKLLVAVAVVLGSVEISKLLFKGGQQKLLNSIFFVLCLSLAYFSYSFFFLSGNFLALSFLLYTCFALLLSKKFQQIIDLKHWILSGISGLFYAGFLPVFAAKLLDLEQGQSWFLALLAVVFAGDIGAYIFGSLFGKTKLFPLLSPKKSLEGSLGGLVFSVLTGVVLGVFLFNFSSEKVIALAGLSLVSAVFAQLGDFFESLLKRVADVKDSGHIMPGHGGVLDRIDGVLFAAPVFFLGAALLQDSFKI